MKGSVLVSQIIIVVITFVSYLVSYMDRSAWGPVIPLASSELGMTALKAGGFMTAFYIGYVVTQIPGGVLTDRFGYRKTILSALVMSGVFASLMGLIHSYWIGFLVRMVDGLASGVIYSACMVAIFDWFPQNKRGRIVGLFLTSTSLGLTLVNIIVPTVANHYSWRASFFLIGGLFFITFALSFFFLKERTTAAERREIQRNKYVVKDVASLFKNRNLLVVCIAGFCGFWATIGLTTWSNSYFHKSLHFSLVEAGLFMSLYGLAGIFGKLCSGFLTDYINRKYLLFWTLLLFCPAMLLFGHNESKTMFYLLAPLLGLFAYVYTPVVSRISGDAVDSRIVGAATALQNASCQFGSLLSPMVAGAVMDSSHNYSYVFLTLAAGPFLGAMVTLLIKLEKKADTAPIRKVESQTVVETS